MATIAKTSTTQPNDAANTGQTTFTASSSAIGCVVYMFSFVASSTVKISSISGSGFTWTQSGPGYATTASVPGGASFLQIWQGVVTAVVTAATQTCVFSASNSALYTGMWPVAEWSSSALSNSTWSVDTAGTGQTNASAASVKYQSITPSLSGFMYLGNGLVGSGGSALTTGTQTGTWSVGPTWLNSVNSAQPGVWGIGSGAMTPTQNKSVASVTASYSVVVGAGGTAPVGGTTRGGFFPFMNHHEQQSPSELWTPERPRLIAPRRRTFIDLAPRALAA